VFVLLAFSLGAIVSAGAWNHSDATLVELIGMPFFFADRIHGAFLIVVPFRVR
jgi:hypothetical protein